MPITKITYGYKDVSIVPAEISYVKSRSECNPFTVTTEGLYSGLPIFTAPMASVVSDENIDEFANNGIMFIIPRNIRFEKRYSSMMLNRWVALSLKEFTDLFCIEANIKKEKDFNKGDFNVCIDVANGHMAQIYDACKLAKKLARKYDYRLTIMTGNIANPKTYDWIRRLNNGYREKYKRDENVIDYIRIGIGGGSGCLTSSRVAIHYGQASLLDECNKIKREHNGHCCPYIIADGGIRDFSDVVKALALGADSVMIGSVFAQMIESAGEKILTPNFLTSNPLPSRNIEDYTDFDYDDIRNEWTVTHTNGTKYDVEIDVKFFGMASGDGQRSICGEKTKVSEGLTKMLPVNFTLSKWTNIMVGCLRSAMSYCNSYTLSDFIGRQELVLESINEINAINK